MHKRGTVHYVIRRQSITAWDELAVCYILKHVTIKGQCKKRNSLMSDIHNLIVLKNVRPNKTTRYYYNIEMFDLDAIRMQILTQLNLL